MKPLQVGLVLTILLAWAAPGSAQLFSSKKTRPNPSQRVPELILILSTETDERKRAHAAEELREYDAATFMEIVPILSAVLQQDKKMSVRMEALNSLVRFRPVTPLAQAAIEKAANDDESWRVRWQAKASLTKLQLTGNTAKKAETNAATGKKKIGDELPPQVMSEGAPITVEVVPMKGEPPARPIPFSTSIPRPLPQSVTPEAGTPSVNAPLPAVAPKTSPAPTSPPAQQGPSLFP